MKTRNLILATAVIICAQILAGTPVRAAPSGRMPDKAHGREVLPGDQLLPAFRHRPISSNTQKRSGLRYSQLDKLEISESMLW